MPLSKNELWQYPSKDDKEHFTRGDDSCTKAKPLFWPVCLSLMRRMLLDERLAYGARAVMMASTVVSGAIFLRMIAVQNKSLYLSTTLWTEIFLIPNKMAHYIYKIEILTVSIEISTGLSFRDSSIIVGFTFCRENDKEVRGTLTQPAKLCGQWNRKIRWSVSKTCTKMSLFTISDSLSHKLHCVVCFVSIFS